MPSVTLTLDDGSPQIRYVGGWGRNTATSATLDTYFQRSCMATQNMGDSVVFTFNGTSIAIYGSKDQTHGIYTVQLDTNAPFAATGRIAGTGVAQQQLFKADDLESGKEHQVTIINGQQAWLDIDYLVYDTDVGGADDELKTTTVDDAAGLFVYSPVKTGADPAGFTSWQTQSLVNQLAYNNTFSATTIKGYMVTVPFTGSSVQVFGGVGANHGAYGVSLDGATQVAFDGSTDPNGGYLARQQIYGTSGLANGPHTLVFTNLDNKFFDVDYAVFNSSRPTAASTSSNSSASALPPSQSSAAAVGSVGGAARKGSSVGRIVASVISVVVALVTVSLIVFLLMRRRRRAQEAAKADAMDTRSIDGDDSAYAVAKDEGTTPGSDVAPAMPVLTPFLYPHNAPPRALSIRELPPLNVVVDRSPITSAVTSPADAEGSPATSSSEHLQPANPAFASGTRRSKTGKIAVSAPSLSVAEERRLRVYGRESDAGPIGRPQVDEEEGETMLPPDYHQAIQPFGDGARSSTRPLPSPRDE